MTHECMTAETAHYETDFDDWPLAHGTRAHLGQIPLACTFCGASISALSDYGWLDTTMYCEEDDEPVFVHCCWSCKRPIAYGEEGWDDPLATGEDDE